MKLRTIFSILALAGTVVFSPAFVLSCAKTESKTAGTNEKSVIVVTYSILGSVVKELVGEAFEVKTLIPNGLDPHEWEPSAKDIEVLTKAALVVQNGLGLEGGMEKSLEQAKQAGVPFFTASEHIQIRTVKAGEGLPTGDPDQEVGAQDPHLWLSPVAIKSVVIALSAELKSRFQIDLAVRSATLAAELDTFDAEIKAQVASIPADKRLLVTGHESLGYFAEQFGYTLVGAIIPSLNSQAQVSVGDLAAIKRTVSGRNIPVVFTEMGNSPKVVEALARELGIQAVEITTHFLAADGSYLTTLRELSNTIAQSLLLK